MLPEIGATEWMVIAAVVLIVVGPKDLPVLMRRVGQFVGRLRSMANDFRASFDEMARQSELDELRKEVAAMRAGQTPSILNTDDGEVNKVFDDIDASLNRPLYDPSANYDYTTPEATEASAIIEPSAIEAPAAPKRTRKPKTETAAVAEPAAKPARKRAAPKAETIEATPAAKPRKTSKATKA